MMKEMPALLRLIWPGKGSTGRFILKILHDGGRGLVELGFYEKLAAHADGPGARGEVGYSVVQWRRSEGPMVNLLLVFARRTHCRNTNAEYLVSVDE